MLRLRVGCRARDAAVGRHGACGRHLLHLRLWLRLRGARQAGGGGALDVRRGRGAHAGPLGPLWRAFGGGSGSRRFGLWGGGGAAVFLEELLRGVVFCGGFELVDRGGALQLEGFEAELRGGEAVAVEGCYGGAHEVHAVGQAIS